MLVALKSVKKTELVRIRLNGRAEAGYWAGHLLAVHDEDDASDFGCKRMKEPSRACPSQPSAPFEVKRGKPARYVPVDLDGRK